MPVQFKSLILGILFFVAFPLWANDNLGFISKINSELIQQQCEESYKAAEKLYLENNSSNHDLIKDAMAHQEVINSIIGETKSAIEDTEGPFHEFIQEYFSHERPTIGRANVLVQKDQRVDIKDNPNVRSHLNGAGFAIGLESSRKRISFRFRFHGNCIATNINECNTTPRESILNVRVFQGDEGELKYSYELDKHAFNRNNRGESSLGQLGFYRKENAFKGTVRNQTAVEDFMNLEKRSFKDLWPMKLEKLVLCMLRIKNESLHMRHVLMN